MSNRILVVEDEPLVRDLIAMNLQHAGHHVDAVDTFAEGMKNLKMKAHDLAILDVMLPDGDGFSLTRQARDLGVTCPILILTARSESHSKVRGFDCGADDYVTKPFDIPELLARVRSLLRRSRGEAAAPAPKVEFGSYWIRFDTGLAKTNEGELSLSDKELR